MVDTKMAAVIKQPLFSLLCRTDTGNDLLRIQLFGHGCRHEINRALTRDRQKQLTFRDPCFQESVGTGPTSSNDSAINLRLKLGSNQSIILDHDNTVSLT